MIPVVEYPIALGLTGCSITYRRHSSEPRLMRLTWVRVSTS